LSRAKLKALEELQKVDLKIRDLSAAAEQHPARLKQIEGDRSQAKAALDGVRGKLADNERARKQNEQLLGLEKEKVKKWESRLNELKTPREYAALARELDIAKKTNETAELELKRLVGEYDDLKKGVGEGEKSLSSRDEVVAHEGKEIQGLLAGVEAEMQELQAEREKLAASCEKSILSKYERIRKQRGGVAVVPVVGGTCKGCQMNLPPQMANNLRTGSDIMTCPSCHRFIYAADHEQDEAQAEP
jgi:predicted  nucleic acid-binding Zn-ribbon protein